MTEQTSFFPWKVQQLLSVVPDFAQDMRERHSAKPVTGKTKSSQQEKKGNPAEPEPELVSEANTAVVEVPREVIEQSAAQPNTEEDWEVLSEKVSNRSVGGEVVVARVGSVRSIEHENSSHTTLSLPFKIQRTNSSSTLDSQDNALGPSGKGVLGVDYVEHVVLPTDTLQGVCLAYKVSASHLRRANHFSGSSLHSAPKKLLIPLSKQALRTGFIRVQDTDTKEYKLSYFQAEFPDIGATETKAYLELADWELESALRSAREDREWEKEEAQTEDLKSGQIGVRINFKSGKPLLNLTGIGKSTKNALTRGKKETSEDEKSYMPQSERTIIVYSTPPAIATKSVVAQDLFNAAHQHNSYGFELKPLPKRTWSPDSSS